MLNRIEPVVLEGSTLRLEPLRRDHLDEVVHLALAEPDVWRHMSFPMATREHVLARFELALGMQAAGTAVTFVTRRHEGGEITGGTSIRLVDGAGPTVEIGATWIVPRWQRTRVNTEAKLLGLAHSFDALGCLRVELKTDVNNLRSQAAIARIGGVREGILRAHVRRPDGTLRDSVLYSLLVAEWPSVRAALEAKLVEHAIAS